MAIAFGLFLAVSIPSLMLWLRSDEKQQSRLPPDKFGWREPGFLLFDYSGGQRWFALGLIAYGAVLAVRLIVMLV